jgi:hypothetical protein
MSNSPMSSRLGPVTGWRGLCRFTLERSQRAYRLNRCLAFIALPEGRAEFQRDEMAVMRRFELSDRECALMASRDYAGLLDHGANLILLGNSAQAFGTTLMGMGLAQRGCTLQEFLAIKQTEGGA